MAFRYSSKIITNGLGFFLYSDASNPRSFVSESTTWYDLTKNLYNGVLTNEPTFDNNNGDVISFYKNIIFIYL